MKMKQGFTLVELLVTLALLSLVIVVVGSVSVAWQRSTISSRLLYQQQQTMQGTLRNMVESLREAGAIDLEPDVTIINPASVTATLPPTSAGHDRQFQFGISGDSVWLVSGDQTTCQDIDKLQVHFIKAQKKVTILLQSKTTISGIKQGLPLIIETSVILRNAEAPEGG